VYVEQDRLSFTWGQAGADFVPYSLSGPMLDDFRVKTAEVRSRLSDLVRECAYAESPGIARACYELALSGHDLYNMIFDPSASGSDEVREIREWMRSVGETQAGRVLEITIDDWAWNMPWNLVYEQDPEEADFLSDVPSLMKALEPFWGLRYNLCCGPRGNPLRRKPLLARRRALAVIDPVLARDLRPDLKERVEAFFGHRNGITVIQTVAELKAAFKEGRPDFLYWCGHASPDALYLDNERISIPDLRNILRFMKPKRASAGARVLERGSDRRER
jgi:hypothetical protein